MKLDRVIARHRSLGRGMAHRLIAAGRVAVNGQVSRDQHHEVSRFDQVSLDSEVIQAAEQAVLLLLHKPAGYLSATVDAQHPTVLDLIDHPAKTQLHLAGRLDRSSTGLVLLTNNGHWSSRLMNAEEKVPKRYLVTTSDPIPSTAIAAFRIGFYFATEDITTRPAKLELLGPCEARVTLTEGRYHQIKRMFHRVGTRVTSLHRESIGPYELPLDLLPGQWREADAALLIEPLKEGSSSE